MAEAKPFSRVKLICGVIYSQNEAFKQAETRLIDLYGNIDFKSPLFAFDITDYYEKQMGKDLNRIFLSFEPLVSPERLSEIKIQTNELEERIKEEIKADRRVVNLDPGYLTPSALIMATAKNFSHRIPLQRGIYAHLELLLTKKEALALNWTYPDYRRKEHQKYFLEVRKIYLSQLKER